MASCVSAPKSITQECGPQSYKLAYVIDGDTFVATDNEIQFKVRIAGIDTPEKKQPLSQKATTKLESLLKNKTITFKKVGKGMDIYSRALGHVYANGENIGLIMIEEGLAYYYRPTCKDYPQNKEKYNYDPLPYINAENKAKESKLGVWSGEELMQPCAWRRKK
jgi:micrococcal nuclease